MTYKIYFIIVFSLFHFSTLSQALKTFQTENGYGLMDSLGKIIIEAKYDEINYKSGYYQIISDKKVGLVDSLGKLIVKPKYSGIESFHDGLAKAGYKGKLGYLNEKGKKVIPFKYSHGSHFYDGYAAVRIKDKNRQVYAGIIDKKGKTVIPFIYDKTNVFNEGLAIVCSNKETRIDKYGAVNKKAEIVIPLKYDGLNDFENGYSIATLNELKGVINTKDSVVVDFKYRYIHGFENGLSMASKPSSKYGFINYSGDAFPFIYSEVDFFHEGFAAVRIGKYWGYINREGKAITEFKFSNKPNPFYKGKGRVSYLGKVIYISPDGTESDNPDAE